MVKKILTKTFFLYMFILTIVNPPGISGIADPG